MQRRSRQTEHEQPSEQDEVWTSDEETDSEDYRTDGSQSNSEHSSQTDAKAASLMQSGRRASLRGDPGGRGAAASRQRHLQQPSPLASVNGSRSQLLGPQKRKRPVRKEGSAGTDQAAAFRAQEQVEERSRRAAIRQQSSRRQPRQLDRRVISADEGTEAETDVDADMEADDDRKLRRGGSARHVLCQNSHVRAPVQASPCSCLLIEVLTQILLLRLQVSLCKSQEAQEERPALC